MAACLAHCLLHAVRSLEAFMGNVVRFDWTRRDSCVEARNSPRAYQRHVRSMLGEQALPRDPVRDEVAEWSCGCAEAMRLYNELLQGFRRGLIRARQLVGRLEGAAR